MTPPPTVPQQWTPLGRTYNTHYFLLADDVLVVMPDKGLKDDAPSAQVNVGYQAAYARLLGRRCSVVVVLDSLTSQDSEARRIYAHGLQPTLFYGVALIVLRPLGPADVELAARLGPRIASLTRRLAGGANSVE